MTGPRRHNPPPQPPCRGISHEQPPSHSRSGFGVSALRGAVSLSLVLSALVLAEGATAPTAAALVPPLLNTVPEQVSADPLPTVQINGVVWDQEIVGNTVYVVGNFSQARPAGRPPGTNQTARANVLAYNLTTGALIPGFVANTNGQVKTVVASPDGSRIYIGGQFTTVNGTTRYRIAALNPTTGAVITTFNADRRQHRQRPRRHQHHRVRRRHLQRAGPGTDAAGPSWPPSPPRPAPSPTGRPRPAPTCRRCLMSPDGSRLFVGGIFLQHQRPERLRDGRGRPGRPAR